MKGSLLEFAFCLLALVLGTGAEELLPKFLGVGFPVLLTAVQVLACGRGTVASATLLAIAAGAMEDAVSALPAMTSSSYFLLVAMVIRWTGVSRTSMLLTYPCYQVWLGIWTGALGGSVFNRILVSALLGVVTAFAVGALLGWAGRKAALDERG